jgi:hypothetical protein
MKEELLHKQLQHKMILTNNHLIPMVINPTMMEIKTMVLEQQAGYEKKEIYFVIQNKFKFYYLS